MTLAEGIELVLDRVGLEATNTTFKNRARRYININAVEIANLLKWWWLNRTVTFRTTKTFTITGASGVFTVGETITGGTSSSTAVVDSHDTTNGLLFVYNESADFTASETITGSSSSTTATYQSAVNTRVYTPVDGHVGAWWSFMNVTDEWPIEIIGPDEYDLWDEDRSLSGNVYKVLVGGTDSTTGYPEVEFYYTPSTTGQEIRARYQMAISTWSASNDGDTFLKLGIPQIGESALVYGATKLLLQEKGDEQGAQREANELVRAVTLMKKQNLLQQGNRRYPSQVEDHDYMVRTDNQLVVEAG
jgi:hypothetical protein